MQRMVSAFTGISPSVPEQPGGPGLARELCGAVLPDDLWKEAVEQTGGRFYPAADEATILRAVHEIDQLAPGKVELREYRSRQLQFTGYALVAVLLWLLAAGAKLGPRVFRTFP